MDTFRLLSSTARALPEPLARSVAKAGGYFHYLASRSKRRAWAENTASLSRLENVAEKVRRWKPFQYQAMNVLEILRACGAPKRAWTGKVRFEGIDNLNRVLERGKGGIVVTCHTGNWEVCGIALCSRGYSVSTVAGEQLRSGWSEKVKEWKRRSGLRVWAPGAELRHLVKDLLENRLVVLHMDGNLFEKGLACRFLGRRAQFPSGPARLASRTESPLVFAAARRIASGGFVVEISEPIEPPSTEEVASVTSILVAMMEKWICADPEQWCIFRKMTGPGEKT